MDDHRRRLIHRVAKPAARSRRTEIDVLEVRGVKRLVEATQLDEQLPSDQQGFPSAVVDVAPLTEVGRHSLGAESHGSAGRSGQNASLRPLGAYRPDCKHGC